MNEREFPRTLEAVEATEITVWGIAEAVYDEVEKTEAGNARHGEYDKVVEFLASHGYREYSKRSIEAFFLTAKWVQNPHLGGDFEGGDFTQFPFTLVRRAKEAAKSNHREAWLLLTQPSTEIMVRSLYSNVLAAKDALYNLRAIWEKYAEALSWEGDDDDVAQLRKEIGYLAADLAETITVISKDDPDQAFAALLGGE